MRAACVGVWACGRGVGVEGDTNDKQTEERERKREEPESRDGSSKQQ